MGRLGIATELLDRVVKEAKVYGCGTIHITASSIWGISTDRDIQEESP